MLASGKRNDSAFSERTLAGYTVVNLSGRLHLDRRWTLEAQVENLFDKHYADHLNRANQDPFNPDPVQVNEPGRTAWAKAIATTPVPVATSSTLLPGRGLT